MRSAFYQEKLDLALAAGVKPDLAERFAELNPAAEPHTMLALVEEIILDVGYDATETLLQAIATAIAGDSAPDMIGRVRRTIDGWKIRPVGTIH